jgi:hypothetical protein
MIEIEAEFVVASPKEQQLAFLNSLGEGIRCGCIAKIGGVDRFMYTGYGWEEIPSALLEPPEP